jgi:hypothetical protein
LVFSTIAQPVHLLLTTLVNQVGYNLTKWVMIKTKIMAFINVLIATFIRTRIIGFINTFKDLFINVLILTFIKTDYAAFIDTSTSTRVDCVEVC